MVLVRAPVPALRPFVRMLWATQPAGPALPVGTRRERLLPTGDAHLALRLADEPLRLCAHPEDTEGRAVDTAVVGGPRGAAYLKDASRPVGSVGAQLMPGAVPALLGVPAGELRDRHVPLSLLWGRAVRRLQEQLWELRGDPERTLDRLEAFLLARLAQGRRSHPAVLHALEGLEASGDVGEAVRASGYSHRHFLALFRDATGLSPAEYIQVRRFRRAVALMRSRPACSLAEVAIAGGYADQAHLTRAFRRHAGITPGTYRAIAPPHAHHVPLGSATTARGQIRSRPRVAS
ncbi:MAG: helix-turn-helix domain-containing protein [Myxococcota bacterium]